MNETIDGQPGSKTVGKQAADALLAIIRRLADGPSSIDDLHAAICEMDRREPSLRTTYRYIQALRRAGFEISRGPVYELLDHPLRDWCPQPETRRQLTEERNRAAAANRAGGNRARNHGLFLQLPRLREHRKAAGYTRQAVGDQAGLSYEWIRQLELGGGTRRETAAGLAAALGVGVEDLRGDQTGER